MPGVEAVQIIRLGSFLRTWPPRLFRTAVGLAGGRCRLLCLRLSERLSDGAERLGSAYRRGPPYAFAVSV